MTTEAAIGETIKSLGFDTATAIEWAKNGRIEAWVHNYLTADGSWADPGFSDELKLAQRWWHGPIEVKVAELKRIVGPEPEMEYFVTAESWHQRVNTIIQSNLTPLSLPPLILEYRPGQLSLRDGNHRFEAISRLGWETCWAIIWYNAETDYRTYTTQS